MEYIPCYYINAKVLYHGNDLLRSNSTISTNVIRLACQKNIYLLKRYTQLRHQLNQIIEK